MFKPRPRAAKRRQGGQAAEDLRGAADDRGKSPSASAGKARAQVAVGGRRGQCRGIGRSGRVDRTRPAGSPRRLRAPRPRHPRRLRLVAAAEARPAGPRPGHLRRRLHSQRGRRRVRAASPQRRLPLRPRIRIRFRITQSERRHRADRRSRAAGVGASRSPATASSSATASSPSTGTAAARRAASPRPGRYKLRVKLLGQDRDAGPAGARSAFTRRRGARAGAARARIGQRPGERRPARRARAARRRGGGGGGDPAAARSQRGRRRCCSPLVLFPVLILGDQWHSAQIVDLRDDTARLVALAALAAAVTGALACALPPLAAPAAAGDRRRASVPDPAPCGRRHSQPAGAALPGDRGRGRRRWRSATESSGCPAAGVAGGGSRSGR